MGPTLPSYVEPHYDRLSASLDREYGIVLTEHMYIEIARQMKSPSQFPSRVHFLKNLVGGRALFAVKMLARGRDRFVGVLRDRASLAPLDVAPDNLVYRYAPRLRYDNEAQDGYRTTCEALARNYQMPTTSFDLYVKMCELCRVGKSEATKFRVRGMPLHRLRLYLDEEAKFPRTFYLLWDSAGQIVVGAIGRRLAESFTHPVGDEAISQATSIGAT